MEKGFSGGATPDVADHRPFATEDIGPYAARAFRDILPLAARKGGKVIVSYPLVLAVSDTRDGSAALFVTVEKGHLFRTCNLCAHERGGFHRNYGAWNIELGTDAFLQRAIALARDHLDQPAAPVLKGMLTREGFERRRKAERARKEKPIIASEFVKCFKTGESRPISIFDASNLPHPKSVIVDALLFAIANAKSAKAADEFIPPLLSLAEYQDGVGDEPLRFPKVYAGMAQDEFVKEMRAFDIERYKAMSEVVIAETTELAIWAGMAKAVNPHLLPFHVRLWHRLRQRGAFSPAFDGYVDFKYAPSSP